MYDIRPHAPLTPLDPMVDLSSRRIAQQARPVRQSNFRNEGDRRPRHDLVHEQAFYAWVQHAEDLELAQAVLEFLQDEAGEESEEAGFEDAERRVEERDDVGAGLRDDEVVDVEELAEAREGTFLGGARVGWVVACCADAGGVVGDYVSGGVFAHQAG